MELFYIINFIISHFIQSNVTHLSVNNCWSIKDKILFNKIAQSNLIMLEFSDLNDITTTKGSIRKLNRNMHTKACHNNYLPQIGIILDFDCDGAYNFIKMANSTPNCFSAHYKWMIFSQQNKFSQFVDLFQNVVLFVDADLFFTQFSNGTVKNYDVYNNGKTKGGKLNVSLASYGKILDQNLTNLMLRSKYDNRQLMKDLKLRMGTVIVSAAYLQSKETIIDYLESSNNTHVEPFSRLGYKYEKLLQDIFQYELDIIVYDKWSTNGSAGGAFGAIIDGTDDLSGVLFTVYPERIAKAHFTMQLGEFRSVFFFRTPRNQAIANGVFLKPFSNTVWITILVTLIVTSLILYKISKVERIVYPTFKIFPTYISLLQNSLAVFCQQDSHYIPKSIGGQFALICFIICSYILNQYYASVVISSLLSSPFKTNIKTLEQLADSQLDVGFEPIVYIYEFLKSNSSSVKYFTKKRVNIQNPNSKQFPEVEKGIRNVQKGGYAYHSEATTAVQMIEKLFTLEEICDLNEVPLRGDFPASIPINKNSPFIEIRRRKYLLLLETGLINKHRKQWMKSRVHCFSKRNVGTVGLEYTAPILIVLICGILSSLVLLLFELLISYYI